ncbi:hypothetical protein DVDV_0959 [Desulfovibrio sp. DV]|uniref:hypothetical protein n=1 Tax=Desulfovibrio sp. DV TaxID=1844708 RepID=UPI00094B7ED4|nr:hypothetical protein [Desulfovibrio sp. DV]OLN29783.1 hypothetical protein DVDV_0959 [Desulfovibrio sp. DV]
MEYVLDTITDRRAVEILARVVKGRGLLQEAPGIEVREAQAALAAAFEKPGPGDIPTEGDLARQCLRLLSQDPDTAQAIAVMAEQPGQGPQRFFLAEVSVVTLALVVLGTRVRYEKDKSGKVSLVVEKEALSDAVLKKFVDMIQRFLPGQ